LSTPELKLLYTKSDLQVPLEELPIPEKTPPKVASGEKMVSRQDTSHNGFHSALQSVLVLLFPARMQPVELEAKVWLKISLQIPSQ
jgi:hypothetical protein